MTDPLRIRVALWAIRIAAPGFIMAGAVNLFWAVNGMTWGGTIAGETFFGVVLVIIGVVLFFVLKLFRDMDRDIAGLETR